MDRFKFRVWSSEEGGYMHNWSSVDHDAVFTFFDKKDNDGFDGLCEYESLSCYDACSCGGCVDTTESYSFKNEDVEQCTGLKDKNGQLIFEGDKVKDKHGFITTVYFLNGAYWLKDSDVSYRFCEYANIKFGKTDLEVIGNIHDES